MTRLSLLLAASLAFASASALAAPAKRPAAPSRPAPDPVRALQVQPAVALLVGNGSEQQLLVSGSTAAGRTRDVTRAASYRSTNPKVARVEPGGLVRGVGDGTAQVEVRMGGRAARVAVQVRNAAVARPLNFQNDVLPVLGKAGCNQAACHAKQGGQGGFQLSVLAFDPEADHGAIVRQANGRRVNRTDPGRSLLLLKATLAVPHGGGLRLKTGSPEYRLLARWIAEGTPYAGPSDPVLTRVEVTPTERTLQPNEEQQLLATAHYSDGSRRDVTRLAQFQSNETAIADADDRGLLKSTSLAGEAAVMVRFMGSVAVARVTVPLHQNVAAAAYRALPRHNFVDELVYRKLARLNLLPSEICDDATYLRRVYLDLIGTLPSPGEVRAFLAECETERKAAPLPSPSRSDPGQRPARKTRAALVERLLNRPEYADYWAMRWVNLLLVDRDPLFPKGAFAYDRWIREAFRANMPFDRFAREIVTASGETYRDGPANFFRSLASPEERAKSVSQLFLGVRIDCAQCHHHPFERWGQDDFYSMAAIFARVRQKGSSEFERIVYVASEGEVRHPKTGEVMPPKPLGGEPFRMAEGDDRRRHLAAWMTAPENPYFARTIVNRMWAWLMSRGIVEPVDDFRVTNPSGNELLLDSLARDFVAHGYDLKHLLRVITASAAYQRSSEATPNNARDTQNYARYYVKRPVAEVLLDAVSQVTGVPEVYSGHPPGSRAIQLWDNKLPVEFLDVFGKPSRLSVCECDRPADGSVTQVLHLMNAPAVQNRLTSDAGTVAALDRSGRPADEVIEELYLAAYSRFPRPDEMQAARAAFARPGVTRRAAIEDLLWVLMNSPEFVFNH